MNAHVRKKTRWLGATVALLTLMGALIVPASTRAMDINGTTYTSPTFGFSFSWDGNWFVMQEMSGEEEGALITNGMAVVAISGFEATGAEPEFCVLGSVFAIRQQAGVTDVTPRLDAAGNAVQGDDPTSKFAVVDYLYTADGGSSLAFTGYFECRVLVEGRALLDIMVIIPSAMYEGSWPAVQTVLNSITIPGQDTATTGTGEPVVLAGEPAPVFVSGPWRVAVRTAADNREFPDLRLKEKDGKEWLVVVADVTNWSNAPATLNARDFFVRPGQDAELVKTAPSSTVSVAEQLVIEPVAEDLTVAFAADETKRVVFVYSIPARSREIALVNETEALPLADTLEASIDPASLPQAAKPPIVELGTFASASDGKTFRVTIDGAAKSTRMLLLGVEPPAEGECFDKEAEKVLDDLAGTQVLVEADSALVDGETPARYVWLINADGTRTLVNELLVSDGRAAAERLPVDARFGAWIRESERVAEQDGAGLWGGCDGSAGATDNAEETVFAIEMIDIAYTQTELVVPANTEITINLVNNGAAVHTFTIDELDVASGDLASGETSSVTFDTGEPGEYEFYCSIPGHREAGMVGTLTVV